MYLGRRILIALVPLALTPVVVWLLAEGYLDFGGGEKDVVLMFPWMLWSVFFAVAFIVASVKKMAVSQSIRRGAGWATGLVILIGLMLFVASSDWLGLHNS